MWGGERRGRGKEGKEGGEGGGEERGRVEGEKAK